MSAVGKLSRYRDIATLGSGGMATVVLAHDTLLGREVALKRMHTAGGDPSAVSRLRREALVGASISHPNLVGIYDVLTTDDDGLVIVMEYVRGETLRDALKRGPMATDEALRILAGIAAGLDAIHERGIVHRDVKPANVLLGADGSIKLADLGIASVPDRTRITSVGTVLGSFSYMAPEQLEDAPATRAIDIYALGAVAYEMLSGVAAHRESNPIAVAHAIATQPPPDLREVWDQAPAPAAELLKRAMARDPAQRPRSAGELVSRLRAALDPQLTQPTPRRAPAAAAAAGAAAAGAGAAAGMAADAPDAGAAAPPAAAHPAAAHPAAAPQSRRPAPRRQPPPAPPGSAQAGRWVALAALLIALGVLAAVLLSSGSSPSHGHAASAGTKSHATSTPARSTPAHSTTHSTSPSTSSTSTPSTSSTPGTTAPAAPTTTSGSTSSTPSTTAPPAGVTPAPGSPAAAVQSFYELAASHQTQQAWALADPTFRQQLHGYSSFAAQQSGDKAIIFHSDRVVNQNAGAATVAIQTTSERTSGTQQCQGTVQLAKQGTGWLLHMIDINCT